MRWLIKYEDVVSYTCHVEASTKAEALERFNNGKHSVPSETYAEMQGQPEAVKDPDEEAQRVGDHVERDLH